MDPGRDSGRADLHEIRGLATIKGPVLTSTLPRRFRETVLTTLKVSFDIPISLMDYAVGMCSEP